MRCKKISTQRACLFLLLLLQAISVVAQNEKLDKYFKASHLAVDQGNYQEALVQLQQVLQQDSTNLTGLDEITLVYEKLKDYAAASRSMVSLANHQPDNPTVLNKAGWLLILDKKYELAKHYLLEALDYNICSFSIYLNLGHVYAILKQEKKAVEFYKKAASYIPSRETYENEILPSFDLLQSLGNLPYSFAPYKNMFVVYYNTEFINKHYGTGIIDSLYRLTTFQHYSYDDPLVISLKERFLTEDLKNEHRRLYVLRDFNWSLGWHHFNTGSKEIALQNYLINVVTISNTLKDTTFVIEALYRVGLANKGGVFLVKQALDLAVLVNNYEKQYNINMALGDLFKKELVPDSALWYFRQSLNLAERSGIAGAKGFALNRMEMIFGELKKSDSVKYYYDLVTEYNISTSQPVADRFSDDLNYCYFLKKMGKCAEAITHEKQFVEYYKQDKTIDIANLYEQMGLCSYRLGHKDDAAMYLRKAITSYTDYMRDNPGQAHDFRGKELYSCYVYLERMALENNKINEIFDLSEQCKANILFLKLTGSSDIPKSITIPEVAQGLKEDEAVLSFSNSYMDKVGSVTGISHDAKMLVAEDHSLMQKLMKVHTEINWDDALETVRKSMPSVKSDMDPTEMLTSIDMLGVIAGYLNNMMSGTGAGRGIRTDNEKRPNEKAEMVAYNDILYQVYIKPFEKLLEGKKTIYISPDVGSALIPFETLQNEKGQYLGDLYNIIYVPSLTTRAILNNKSTSRERKMVAFGDPVYSTFDPHNTTGRAHDLTRSGMGSFDDLPGTAIELRSIQTNVPSATIINGAALTESKIKSMSNNGTLEEYDIIHFAVHGMVSLANYQDNAIIISENPGTNEDGFLQFNEIAALRIHADLVCLSACQTAAGIPSEGEEVKNLPVAFFLAGARSVIATWWKIDDEASGMFMSSFYKLVFKENKTYSEALHITRQQFISGAFGDKYKAPYYWAAFKYFGH